MTPQESIAALNLTVQAVFVPFSRSRSKADKHPNLNWVVTLQRNGKDILTTDYSAGMAHCPAYNRKIPAAFGRPGRMWQPLACAFECEQGFQLGLIYSWNADRWTADRKKPILPDSVGVIYSLVMDSNVLDSGGFDDWASDYGYDTDSRAAESIYRACLDLALKMRAGIGESGLAILRESFEDY